MITYKMIKDAQDFLVENWGEKGEKVIEVCATVVPFNNSFKAFLDHCTCCGGNWGGMFLTGIEKLFPEVWEAIPDDMGIFAWQCLCQTLILCGVDVSAPERGE